MITVCPTSMTAVPPASMSLRVGRLKKPVVVSDWVDSRASRSLAGVSTAVPLESSAPGPSAVAADRRSAIGSAGSTTSSTIRGPSLM